MKIYAVLLLFSRWNLVKAVDKYVDKVPLPLIYHCDPFKLPDIFYFSETILIVSVLASRQTIIAISRNCLESFLYPYKFLC